MSETTTAPSQAPQRTGLDALVKALRPIARRRADPKTIAERTAAAFARMRPSAADLLTAAERAGSPDHYSRHTLHAEAAFSLSAVVWRPGQVTEIHDHLVWCSFMVLEGTETETLFGFEGGRLVEVGERRRAPGSVSGAAPPDDVHRVRNTGDAVAITLHAYGADLSQGTSVRRTYREPAAR